MIADVLAIDGQGPFPVERPASVAALGECVRRCGAAGQAIYPVGGGTMLDLGGLPARPGVAIDLRGLDQVIDFPARDMTITVQAGITLAALHARVRAEGLHLPLDVPASSRATLGGALATNASGPRRHGHGTWRDFVLGISTINDRGDETRAGGRVVKNVAGYDLMKLHIGALGTLGLITQATLKLKPAPRARALFSAGCGDDALEPILDRLHASPIRPMAVELVLTRGAALRPGDSPRPPWQLTLIFEDHPEAVAWQFDRAAEDVRDLLAGPPRRFEDDLPLQALVDLPIDAGSGVILQLGVPPSATARTLIAAAQAFPRGWIQAHAGSGVIRVGLPHGTPEADAVELMRVLRRLAEGASGHLWVRRCPADWKPRLALWGPEQPDWAQMRRVRAALDPRTIFNPGRFLTDA